MVLPLALALGGAALSGIGAGIGGSSVEDELARQAALRQGFQQDRVSAGQGTSSGLAGIGNQQLQNQSGFLQNRLDAPRDFTGQQIQGQFQDNLGQALGGLSFLQPAGQAGQVQAAAGQQFNQQQLQPSLGLLGQQGIQQQLGGLDAGMLRQLQMQQAPLDQNARDIQSSGQFNLANIGLQEQQALGDAKQRLTEAGQAGGGLRLLGSLAPQIGLGFGAFMGGDPAPTGGDFDGMFG